MAAIPGNRAVFPVTGIIHPLTPTTLLANILHTVVHLLVRPSGWGIAEPLVRRWFVSSPKSDKSLLVPASNRFCKGSKQGSKTNQNPVADKGPKQGSPPAKSSSFPEQPTGEGRRWQGWEKNILRRSFDTLGHSKPYCNAEPNTTISTRPCCVVPDRRSFEGRRPGGCPTDSQFQHARSGQA